MEIMIRKAQPTPGDVHVDSPMTNISIAYLQAASLFVADRVFPNIPVQKQSDLYFKYDRGMFNRDQMPKPRASATPWTRTVTTSATCGDSTTTFPTSVGRMPIPPCSPIVRLPSS